MGTENVSRAIGSGPQPNRFTVFPCLLEDPHILNPKHEHPIESTALGNKDQRTAAPVFTPYLCQRRNLGLRGCKPGGAGSIAEL
jgi:hypothetical protein